MKRKLSKTEIVLSLYTGLMDGKEIAMDEFCSNFSISVPTFKRYIQEIRSFLSNSYLPYELLYSRTEKVYKFRCSGTN